MILYVSFQHHSHKWVDLLHAHASVSAFEGKGFHCKLSTFVAMLDLMHSGFFSNDYSILFCQHRNVSVDWSVILKCVCVG